MYKCPYSYNLRFLANNPNGAQSWKKGNNQQPYVSINTKIIDQAYMCIKRDKKVTKVVIRMLKTISDIK